MPLCRSPLTLRLALFSRSRTAAVEIPRFILHRRRSEFLPLHRGAKKRAQSPLCDPYTGEPRFALRKATVMRTRILSVTPVNPLGVTAPLMNKGSQEARSVRLAEDREPRALLRRAQICRGGTTPSRCAATRGTPKHFAKGRNISHAQSAYFTAPQARFHTAAKLPYITAARRDAHSLLQPFGTKKSL